MTEWNHARLEAWTRELCRGGDPCGNAELYKSVRAFFRFLEEVSHDLYVLYEDVDYGHLARRGVTSDESVTAFRADVVRLKPTLVRKAERYAEIRHDDSVSEDEKERIRVALFGNDHLWPVW